MSSQVWQQPEIISWSQIILDSFAEVVGKELLARKGTPAAQAEALFFAPFVVVSHGTQAEPIFNYGNQVALDLWEINWQNFIQTPSRSTAEPINQLERQQMLEQVAQKGYVDNYSGVRISSTGKRFLIKNTIIWNLRDRAGNYCGQAANYAEWDMIKN
ncbi:MEKHLA domain protein [Stanieria cyanosphaera PCC 7437]|uniref:MEKHLA domain protein n=1 Tax=Stanieria cyanosphaera (strain ATCC 29371 / PCC 7437) TaxID=111780 RepID=K9XXK8_STAC7|nr:MEKHLA domain-containing protein [Stanieria cyanosphaera]AFZ37258.1 MEKHLA domain protein [Stanieria cyanosphaera PCC 7437]